MKGLTDRQADILDFINWYWKEYGKSPTYKIIGDASNMRENAAKQHVTALKVKGRLDSGESERRGIYPVGLKAHIRKFFDSST